MRGKVHGRSHFVFPLWITPAYAGKRSRNGIHLTMSWDHPRLCGEKMSNGTDVSRISGSPPPMRGKEEMLRRNYAFEGITPAYAGKRKNQWFLLYMS